MCTLVVAAGGGGDAVTGAALRRQLSLTEPPVVLTYSWDRLMIDPMPGPRSARDFTGLRRLAPGLDEILPTTRPVAPAGSALPRLAAALPGRLLLLDPADGPIAMATQVRAAATIFGAEDVAVVDVGGDVLTDGADPGLRSPLADQLALAAVVLAGLPARLLVAAPGLDGELPAATVLDRLDALAVRRLPDLTTDDVGPVRSVFEWHPSEASGLLAAAAAGIRGRVEVRDAGDLIDLTDRTTRIYSVSATDVLPTVPAALLARAGSLAEAEQIIEAATGISEIRYETVKACSRDGRTARMTGVRDLDDIDSLADRARSVGADFVSMRRLAELLGATSLDAFTTLCALLREHRPERYLNSLYRTHRRQAS